jgi:hypothetical protein
MLSGETYNCGHEVEVEAELLRFVQATIDEVQGVMIETDCESE